MDCMKDQYLYEIVENDLFLDSRKLLRDISVL